jgi:hypothetical protein
MQLGSRAGEVAAMTMIINFLPVGARHGTSPSDWRTGRAQVKHCGASARQRTRPALLFLANNLFHQRLEARIAAKIVEQGIYFDERNVESGVVVVMLQFVDRVRLIA